MSRKIKFSKVAIVAFLTVLIWVWADLALDETLLVPNVSINIVKSSNPALWATFRNEDGQPVSSTSIEQTVLKGPTSRIAEANRELSKGVLNLDFALNPELREMTTAGSHTLPVLGFLRRRSSEIGELTGLTVESCEPNTLTVNVEMLVETPLAVKCFDQGGRLQEFQSIEPETVTMFVPEDWGRDSPARVALTPSEIKQARSTSVQKKPYIVLADGQERRSNNFVEVRIPPEEDILGKGKVREVTVGYCFSANTQNYRVVLDDEAAVVNAIDIRATPEAKLAYENEAYQVILEIYDVDREATDWVQRPLKYNFPDEYVRKDELELDQDPVTARFKLIRLPSADGS